MLWTRIASHTQWSALHLQLTFVSLLLAVIAVGAQDGVRDPFIIRVPDTLPTAFGGTGVGSIGGLRGARFNFDFDSIIAQATGTGANGAAGSGNEAAIPAADVVLEDLNLLQRNNLIAAAGGVQVPAPVQRMRQTMNSGLRRR